MVDPSPMILKIRRGLRHRDRTRKVDVAWTVAFLCLLRLLRRSPDTQIRKAHPVGRDEEQTRACRCPQGTRTSESPHYDGGAHVCCQRTQKARASHRLPTPWRRV